MLKQVSLMLQIIAGLTKVCRYGINLYFCFEAQGSERIKPGSKAAQTPSPLQKGTFLSSFPTC